MEAALQDYLGGLESGDGVGLPVAYEHEKVHGNGMLFRSLRKMGRDSNRLQRR